MIGTGGDVLGVLQALNKFGNDADTTSFSKNDEEAMQLLCSSIAVAIEHVLALRMMLSRQESQTALENAKQGEVPAVPSRADMAGAQQQTEQMAAELKRLK